MEDINPQDLIPGLSVDSVIFGFHERELKVLLLKLKGVDDWALPGGFIRRDESVDRAAQRVVEQRTGLDNLFLRQFELFGDIDRHEEEQLERIEKIGLRGTGLFDWFNQRFITMGYYALVAYVRVKTPTPDNSSEKIEWCSLNELPPLILDHERIIHRAHQELRRDLASQPIGINLLPEKFTMPELQALYETLLGKELDRRNFQRKMIAHGILHRTNERRSGGAHKAPWLYRFDEKAYEAALEDGLNTGW